MKSGKSTDSETAVRFSSQSDCIVYRPEVETIESQRSKLENIVIRPVHPDDAADLYEIIRNPAVTRTLIQVPSMEFRETLQWIKKPPPGTHRLVADVRGKAVASGSLIQNQRPRLVHSGRIGLMVDSGHWNQGVGSAVVAALLNLADNWLNLRRLELDVFTHNPAAIHLYEKFGFVSEGIRRCVVFGEGRWLDEIEMARLRNPEPLPGDVGAERLSRPVSNKRSRIENVDIRPLHPDDTEDLYAIFCHPAVGRTTLQLPSQEIIETQERVNNPNHGLFRFVAAVRGRVIGIATLNRSQRPRLDHSAGLGMAVHPDFWGRGIGSQLVEALLDLADNWLNLKRIDLDVNTDNHAGIRLYEKYGFEIEGTKIMHTFGDGRWADSHFMARIRK